MNKKISLFILLLATSLLLFACTKDKDKDNEEVVKDLINIEEYYETDSEKEIAKKLIGKKFKNIEGYYLNGGSFDLAKEKKDLSILKISTIECEECLISNQNNLEFINARGKDISFYEVYPNVPEKESIIDIIKKDGNTIDSFKYVVHTEDDKVISDYKVEGEPMYVFIKDNTIRLVVFGEQTAKELTKHTNKAFGTNYIEGAILSEEMEESIQDGLDSINKAIKDGSLEETDDYNRKILNGEIVNEDNFDFPEIK